VARGPIDGVGIYDREYYRQQRPGLRLAMPQSAVVTLILINVAVYVVDMFSQHLAYRWLAVRATSLTDWRFLWQFLTYGFVHDPRDISHIVLNMFGLWMLGRDVESRYGTKEFLRLYLVLIVVGGLVWAIVSRIAANPLAGNPPLLGASGAIVGIVILYALNFPHRTMLFMFVVPMPAWVLGLLVVGFDLLGQMGWLGHGTGHSQVAYLVHLTGAAFAAAYFFFRWNFGWLFSGNFQLPRWKRKPRLRIHDPEEDDEPSDVAEEDVDRILEKIYREGEASLTRKERRVLETASRAYQRRRRPEGMRD